MIRAAVLAVVCYVFFKFFFFKMIILPVRIEGNSMFPTYRDHGWNYVNKLSYRHSEPQRGDVVSIRMSGEHVMYLKRIVGLPGETVAFRHGNLYINGQPMPEPYLKSPLRAPKLASVTLGPDEYYVIGDNRMNSDQGRVKREKIVGRVIL